MKNSKFQFEEPVLSDLKFAINENFDRTLYSGVSILGNTRIFKSRTQNEAKVIFKLKIGEEISKRTPFSIEIAMEAEFTWHEGMKEDLVNDLLKQNAPSLLLSYMRPIVSNITSASKYPAFNIPYLNMQENDALILEIE